MKLRMSLVVVLCALGLTACKKKPKPAADTAKPGQATKPDSKTALPTKPGQTKARPVKPVPLKKGLKGSAAKATAEKNVAAAPAAPADQPKETDKGDLKLSYGTGEPSEVKKMVQASGMFEALIADLNKSLLLPRDIPVVFENCDEPNAFFDPETVQITVCNELLDYYSELYSGYAKEDQNPAILGSLSFTFLHELGHALINQLELPAIGREEDAADQLATVVLVAGGDQGEETALQGAESFIAAAEAPDEEKTPFWDEHSLDEQRFYNVMCLIYGSNAEKYKGLVNDDNLPKDRADQCPDEYASISGAWDKLLAPFQKVEASEPAEPAKPAEPAEPAKPAEPAEPAKP